MTFSTLYFVFAFLPVVLLIYRFLPDRLKNAFLVLASLIFYAWGGLTSIVYLLFSAAFNYLAGMQMDVLIRKDDRRALKLVTTATAIGNIVVLALFKYVTGSMPLGLSFYTFSVLSYIFDVYQGNAAASNNIIGYMLYVSFFPKVTMGPIVQYAAFEEQVADHPMDRAGLAEGARLFIIGLGKKVLLADMFGNAFASVSTSHTVLSAWLGVLFYGLQLYYDFSGYSDMAIGLARMFGFKFEKNFDHPYMSRSVGEFWRRWHISLGNWFKQYVYFPMGGSRVPEGRIFLNLLTVWLLTGIWHGNTLNYLIWGLYHGFFVILEKFVIKDKMDGLPDALRALLTSLVAFIGWIFFFTGTLPEALGWFGSMFGIGAQGFADNTALFALKGNLLLLIAGLIGVSDFVDRMFRRIFYGNVYRMNENLVTGIATAIHLIILISCVASMVGSTYSSFLYFKF